MDLFKGWDMDGDGTISVDEFKIGIRDLGICAPDDEIEELFASFDYDNSGGWLPLPWCRESATSPALVVPRVPLLSLYSTSQQAICPVHRRRNAHQPLPQSDFDLPLQSHR